MDHDPGFYKGAGCMWAILFAPFFLLLLSTFHGEGGVGLGLIVFSAIFFITFLGRLLLEVFALETIGESLNKFFGRR